MIYVSYIVVLLSRTQVKVRDIVIAKSPSNPRGLICKRVAAVEGESVEFLKNGSSLLKIPPGQVWLLGDNSIESEDSRYYIFLIIF